MQLDDGARVKPSIDRAFQSDATKSRWRAQTSHATQKLGAVGGDVVRIFTGGEKCHTSAELAVEMIGGNQSILIRDELRHDMGLLRVAGCAKHPLGIISNRDAARTFPQILQTQLNNL